MNHGFPSIAIALLACAAAHASSTESWCTSGGAIPDAGTLTASVAVPAGSAQQRIVSVRVQVIGTHPWVGDLRIRAVHPSGVSVLLLDRPGMPSNGYPGPWGCGGDGLGLWFDDTASALAESTCPYGVTPVLAGNLRPSSQLSAFAGLSPTGTWSLAFEDAVLGDSGSISRACIEIVTVPACAADLDGDGSVGGSDLALLIARWGPCTSCAEDLNGDGRVSGEDLAIVLSIWGPCGANGAN